MLEVSTVPINGNQHTLLDVHFRFPIQDSFRLRTGDCHPPDFTRSVRDCSHLKIRLGLGELVNHRDQILDPNIHPASEIQNLTYRVRSFCSLQKATKVVADEIEFTSLETACSPYLHTFQTF